MEFIPQRANRFGDPAMGMEDLFNEDYPALSAGAVQHREKRFPKRAINMHNCDQPTCFAYIIYHASRVGETAEGGVEHDVRPMPRLREPERRGFAHGVRARGEDYAGLFFRHLVR